MPEPPSPHPRTGASLPFLLSSASSLPGPALALLPGSGDLCQGRREQQTLLTGTGKGEICRSRRAATLAWCGKESPVCFMLAPGPHCRFSEGRQWGPFSLPSAGEDAGHEPGLRSPWPLLGGWKEGCLGLQGARPAAGMGGTALYWVWSAQIPGGGSNLALPVWLSPDTRGQATKRPRQSNLVLDRGGQSGTHCLFGRERGPGGERSVGRPGRKGPEPLSAGWFYQGREWPPGISKEGVLPWHEFLSP